MRTCPQCGAENITEAPHVEKFLYGIGDAAVTLEAAVTLHSCAACDFDWLDHKAEALMDEAIRIHRAKL